jgi:hypothetical protein
MILQRHGLGLIRLVTGLSLLMVITSVRAHFMVEQHGTINFTNGGAFLVLSVPVSAFDGVDDDGDGALSARELGQHTAEVEQQFYDSVQLLNGRGESLPLQGLLMSLVSTDHAPTAPARQLIAFGRFAVTDAITPLDLRIVLQGKTSEEKNITITATRDGSSQEMVFSPDRQHHSIFSATFVNKNLAE